MKKKYTVVLRRSRDRIEQVQVEAWDEHEARKLAELSVGTREFIIIRVLGGWVIDPAVAQ